jgi:siroheme decarboxylase
MDETDKRILNILQSGFPLTAEPFAEIARQVGISENETLERVGRMKDSGVIRRIGAIFESRKLGFASALCAARVPESSLPAFVKTVNAYTGVTHNYRRNHPYNVWFTCIAPTAEALGAFLDDLRDKTNVRDILCMRAVKTFKVNAQFDV